MSIQSTGLVLVSALLLGGCTSNPYFIGSGCPGANGPSRDATPCGATVVGAAGASSDDSGLSFAVDLDQSGVSRMSAELELPAGPLGAALRLRGENATASAWPSDDAAFSLQMGGIPVLALAAPFTDDTGAVGLSSGSSTYMAESSDAGALGSDDFAIELVFRTATGATLVDKRGSGVGWAVNVTPEGVLTLDLQDAQSSVQILSEPLVPEAWYDCLFWVSHAAGGRVYCNGREGASTDVSALGNLDGATTLAIGGGPVVGDLAEVALLAVFDAKVGLLGDPVNWPGISRKRFAALTGVSPRAALGSALPQTGLRDSAAYLDLQKDSTTRLFLVGPDWPRVTCLRDAAGVRDCGYLSEPKRTRWASPEAAAWTASELSVSPNQADFADGERRMSALVPSPALAPHTLSWTGTYSGARQVLSFFVRAEAGQFVAASVSNRVAVIFDLGAGAVVTAVPASSGVRTTIEAWGNGLFRCSYAFEPDAGALTYQLEALGDASGAPFAGDGSSAWLDLAGLQLDVGEANAGSLLASDTEAADQLTFLADDGNLPTSSAVNVALRVLLPAGARLTDQAVLSLNLGGEFENQVELYVTGDTGQLKFWGLRDGATHWAFTHPASFTDGLRHTIEADWQTGAAQLSVDGVPATENALIANTPPFSLDRIDVGFSSSSSGSLEGLLAGIEIGTGAP
jgi:hypothetical protein